MLGLGNEVAMLARLEEDWQDVDRLPLRRDTLDYSLGKLSIDQLGPLVANSRIQHRPPSLAVRCFVVSYGIRVLNSLPLGQLLIAHNMLRDFIVFSQYFQIIRFHVPSFACALIDVKRFAKLQEIKHLSGAPAVDGARVEAWGRFLPQGHAYVWRCRC